MKNDVIADDVIFQKINFTIKSQYKFAIFYENLKIFCRVVSEKTSRTTLASEISYR